MIIDKQIFDETLVLFNEEIMDIEEYINAQLEFDRTFDSKYLAFLAFFLGIRSEIAHLIEDILVPLEILSSQKIAIKNKTDKSKKYNITRYPLFNFNYKCQHLKSYKVYFEEINFKLNRNLVLNKEVYNDDKFYRYCNDAYNLLNKIEKYFKCGKYPELKILIYNKGNYKELEKELDNFSPLFVADLKLSFPSTKAEIFKKIDSEGYYYEEMKIQSSSLYQADEENLGISESYVHLESKVSNPTEYMKMKGRYIALQKANVKSIAFTNTITLNELVLFYRYYDNNTDPNMKALLSMLIISAHTGLDVKQIRTMVKRKNKTLHFDRYYYKFSYTSKLHKKNPDIVEIYLPIELYCLLKDNLDTIKYMSDDEFEDTLSKFRKFYYRHTSFILTFVRVKNFFDIYYENRYGLPDIFIKYISTYYSENKESKQHYVSIPLKKLNDAYHRSFEQCIEETGFVILSDHIISGLPSYLSTIGSRNIPSKELIVGFFKELYSLIDKIKIVDSHTKFNFFSGYIYHLILFLTGIRPIKVVYISKHNLSFEGGILLINDKNSKYREYRIIPICDFFKEEIRCYLNNFYEKVFSRIDFGLYDKNFNKHKVFMMDSEYETLDFTKEDLRVSFYPHFSESTQILFNNYRKNYFRHYIKNSIFEDYGESISNVYLGHFENGLEVFNPFSDFDFSKYAELCISLQENLVKEFSIESVFKRNNKD